MLSLINFIVLLHGAIEVDGEGAEGDPGVFLPERAGLDVQVLRFLGHQDHVDPARGDVVRSAPPDPARRARHHRPLPETAPAMKHESGAEKHYLYICP